MKRFDDEEEDLDGAIVVPPKCGWQSLDGLYNFQNNSTKTVLIEIYEETDMDEAPDTNQN